MALDVWDQQDSIWIILEGGYKLLDEVNGFCDLHEIDRVDMESAYIDPKQHRKKQELQTSITMQWIALMMLLIG